MKLFKVFETFLRALIPILSIVTTILSALTLVGTTNNSQFSKDIYALQVNFTNVRFRTFIQPTATFWNISDHLSLEDSGLSEIYTFGLRGYCKGSMDGGSYKTTYCSGIHSMDDWNPAAVFYNDLYNAESNPLNENRTYTLEFPLHVPNFEGAYYRRSIKVSYYGILIGCIISGIASVIFIIRFIDIWYIQGPLIQLIGWIVAFISLIAFLAGGGVATKLFADTRLGFKRGSGIYRILGTWGNTKFWLFLWFAISFQVLMLFLCICYACCLNPDIDRRIIALNEREKALRKEAKEKELRETGGNQNLKSSFLHDSEKHSSDFFDDKKRGTYNNEKQSTKKSKMASMFIKKPKNTGLIQYNVNK